MTHIDTGTGGFPIDNAGTLATLDNGSSFGDEQEKAGAGAIKWSGGDINVAPTSDLSKGTKKKLAYYLSQTTKGKTDSSPSQVGNEYPVEQDAGKEATEIRTTTPDGYAADLTVINEDQPHYIDTVPGDSRSDAAVVLKFTKGREKPDSGVTETGNTLVKNAVVPGTQPFPPPKGSANTTQLKEGTVKDYVAIVTDGNKFTAEEPRIPYQYAGSLRTEAELETQQHTGYPTDPAIDIPAKKKRTLANYLAGMTRGTIENLPGNKFSVDATTVEASITGDFGRPAGIAYGTNSQQYMSEQEWTSFSAKSSNNPVNVTDGKGHDILRRVKGEADTQSLGAVVEGGAFVPPMPETSTSLPDNSPVSQYYGKGSKSIIGNRFNPDQPYNDIPDLNQFSLKYPAGRSLGGSDPGRKYSFGDLSRIGSTLSMRSGLEIGSSDANFDPNSNLAVAGAILPGTAQLGIRRISRDKLDPGDLIRTLEAKGIDENTLINPAADSWGHLNNVNDPFTGVSSYGMQLLAAALVVALTLIISALTALFSILQSGAGGNEGNRVDIQGRLPYGASTKPSSAPASASPISIAKSIFGGTFNVWRLLGFTETRHDMSACLSTGVLRFFGVDPSQAAGLGGQALAIADAVTETPGYYAIMARNISRSFLQIADAFSSMTKAFDSGLVSGIKQIFEVLDILRESKFIQALNIFTSFGDKYLDISSADPFETFDTDAFGISKRFKGTIDRASINDPTVLKNRLGNWTRGVPGTTLAWSSFRSPDLLVMPAGILDARGSGASSKLGVPSLLPRIPYEAGGTGLKTPTYYPMGISETRIPTEIREKMEDMLESEYVPFYFHDVRTNEIISFHAFLAGLSDSYNANYDTSDGFGRIEAIKTYKSTTRKLGLSFYIVATSPKDFDSMWLKINKLTTLVYPQFTEGRPLFGDDYVMHVPFSQMISAAPMIRLRIGDLFKSNYSKFNLARLFGYASPGTKFDGDEYGNESSGLSGEELAAATQTITDKFYSPGNYFRSTTPLQRQILKSTSAVSLGGASNAKTDPTIVLPPGFVLKITAVNNDDTFDCVVEEAKGEDLAEQGDPGRISDVMQAWRQALYGNSHDIIGKLYEFRRDELLPTITTRKKIDAEITNASSNHSYSDKVKEFMTDNVAGKGNAIARSFRSSGGRGIPGFIDSLAFDWYDHVTWELGEGINSPGPYAGRRAPKMCKVDISFSPFHDIAPGLDHMGANRAPVYPVGPLS